MDKSKKIIVGIPAYNEEKHIGEVLQKIPSYVDEVIVVDDCSKDKTSEVAKKNGATVIRHKENRGIGGGYKTMYNAFLERDADIMVLLNGDGQHDPKDISTISAPLIKEEADYVLGSRFIGRTVNIPFNRLIGNKIITWTVSLGLGKNVTDSTTGYHGIAKRTLQKLDFNNWSNNYLVETDAIFDIAKNRLRIIEVPITCIYGDEVSSINSFEAGKDYFLSALRFLLRERLKLKFL